MLGALAPDAALDAVRARVRAGDLDGAAALLLARFLEAAPARFFEGAVSPDVPGELRRRTREAEAALVGEAESVLAGRFDLLGYRGLSFGDPLDWHLDPVSGKRAPLVHWTDVDFLDAGRVGDSKVIWELNRHQWLVRLGQAYRMTGDERYAERFAAVIGEWTRANPPGVGINWASSLEVAFRIISWSWAVDAVPRLAGARRPGCSSRSSRAWPATRPTWSAISRATTRRTRTSPARPSGSSMPVWYFPSCAARGGGSASDTGFSSTSSTGRCCPTGSTSSGRPATTATRSRSTCTSCCSPRGTTCRLPREIAERLEDMVDVLLALREPDGSMPAIGDADGGSLLPLAPRQRGDLRGVFAVAAAVFPRPDYAWAAEGPAPRRCGSAAPRAPPSESLAPRAPESAASLLLAEGGYGVMRSGWDRRAHQLVFDTGPLGCPVSAGHGHADLLGVQCTVFGEATIADPGTFCYTAEPAWRDFFRGTAAHSTVRVDGLDQAVPRGPFSWQARPSARLLRWVTTESLDVADAEHDAYARLADPVTHRRRVLWIKPRYWIIIDDLGGAATHDVELRFQFAPIEVTLDPALWARAHTASGPGLFIHPFSTAPLTAEVVAGGMSPRPAGSRATTASASPRRSSSIARPHGFRCGSRRSCSRWKPACRARDAVALRDHAGPGDRPAPPRR